jgi:hypothetical protein
MISSALLLLSSALLLLSSALLLLVRAIALSRFHICSNAAAGLGVRSTEDRPTEMSGLSASW